MATRKKVLMGLLTLCLQVGLQVDPRGLVPEDPPDKIKAESIRVVVPISVQFEDAEPVAGLKREDFTLAVDKAPVSDFQLLHNADIPVFMGVVFDHSSQAVIGHFGWMKEMIRGLIHQFSPEDRFFLATYGYDYVSVQSPTSDRIEIMETLNNMYPQMFSTRASFWDYFKTGPQDLTKKLKSDPPNKTAIALDRSLHSLEQAENPKKVLLIFSDGDENLSDITLHHVQRYGYPCYFIYFNGSGFGQRSLFRRGEMLKTVARETGGGVITPSQTDDPSVVGRKISEWVRNQYLISFEPSAKLDRDKTHGLVVTVNRPTAKLYYRKSFRFVKE
jgi:VWFA-related protein